MFLFGGSTWYTAKTRLTHLINLHAFTLQPAVLPLGCKIDAILAEWKHFAFEWRHWACPSIHKQNIFQNEIV